MIAHPRNLAMLAITIAVAAIAQLTWESALAQSADTSSGLNLEEPLWSSFAGVDARAMAMGNSGIALSRDGSGMVYNPANLARIKRIELRAGLSHLNIDSDSRRVSGMEEFTDSRDLGKTRITALSLTLPVPTYRGSMVFGFGLHRVNTFDRPFGSRFAVMDAATSLSESVRIRESGGLWKWTAAGALDISSRLAVGLGLNLLTGANEFRWNLRSVEGSQIDDVATTLTFDADQKIDNDYIGASAAAGLSYAASPALTVGLVVETPTYLTAEEKATYGELLVEIIDTASSDYVWEYRSPWDTAGLSNYSFTRPFSFGLGAAFAVEHLNLAADLKYTDWRQLTFGYDDNLVDPPLDADESAKLRFIEDSLTDVLAVHLGAEFLIPAQGISLRAGYYLDPLPLNNRFIESQRKYVTAGFGFLIDRVMTLDLAYVHGGYELRDGDPGTFFAKYKTRRVFATFGYRI